MRAATVFAYGDNHHQAILNKRELVPNTNRHAIEGSNPVWMTGVGYDNFDYSKEYDADGLPMRRGGHPDDDEEIVERRNNLNGVGRRSRELLHPADSLDANVLNDHDDFDEDDDVGYDESHSHVSNSGSTVRVGSRGAAGGGSGHPSSSNGRAIHSTRSSSSGLGSGTSRSRLSKIGGGIYSKNMTIAALFPAQMPPVEKLNGGTELGKTVYDEDDMPRTEL